MVDTKTIEDRLRVLEVFPDTIERSAQIFLNARTEAEVKQEMARVHTDCSAGQFLYFHFRRLVELQPEILDEVESRLSEYGVEREHIRKYFSSGADPEMIMSMDYGEKYPEDIREKFFDAAYCFALGRMKEYLGIE